MPTKNRRNSNKKKKKKSKANADQSKTATLNTGLCGNDEPLLSVAVADSPTEKLVEKTTEPNHEDKKPMTLLNTELHGHGDPLLSAATGDMPAVKLDEKTTEPIHETPGQGDTLLHEVLTHSMPPTMALHSECQGQGDPVMASVIEQFDEDVKEKVAKVKNHTVVHEEFQNHGDPHLEEYCDELNVKAVKEPAVKAEYTFPEDLHLEPGEYAA